MSSLALQLFVNLNKLINQHADAGMGSHHAKELVERVKTSHPELLGCTDPSNAHTAALTAFAVGLGLRELRRADGNQFTQHALSEMLKDALDRADDQLERLAPQEVHLVLQAHEEYKTYMGARADLISRRSTLGRARGVDDILPSATTSSPMWPTQPTWRMEERVVQPDILPLHASDIDIGTLDLPELEQALTGEVSFHTQRTGPNLLSSVASEPVCDFPEISGEITGEDNPQGLGAEKVETSNVVELDQYRSAEQSSFAAQGGFLQAHAESGRSIPLTGGSMHPMRADRQAERELADAEDGLRGESVDEMLARQRRQADMRRQEIPVYESNWQEANRGGGERLPIRGSVMEQSQWSESDDNSLSTYLHSESAPDTTGVASKKKRKAIPAIVWGAPTFVLLPPLGLFYAGVLWGRESYGSSLATLCLSLAGAGGLIAWWFLR